MELPPSSRRATGSRLAGVHRANPSPPLDASSYVVGSVANFRRTDKYNPPRAAADRRAAQSGLCRACPGARSVVAAAPPLKPRLSAPSRASRSSRRPACAGSTSSARARSSRRGWRSASTSIPSTTRTSARATSARRSTSTTTTCSSCCTSRATTRSVSRLNAAEVDIFVGPDYLITLPNEPLQTIELPVRALPAPTRSCARRCSPRARATCSTRSSMTASTPRSRCWARSATSSSASRRRSSRARATRSCATSPTPSRRSSTSARSSARSGVAFRDLERNKARYIAEDLDIYFDDIIDASERAWDLLENYKEVVEGLEATNESAIAHRTNETFRVLTAISLIFLPLTLIASVFGMNVQRPGRGVHRTRSGSSWSSMFAIVVGRRRVLPTGADGSERRRRRRRVAARRAPRSACS